jgi:uncharacterized protein YrrD
MRTAGELSGLAVIGENSGDKLGRLQDIYFDSATGQVTGFLVNGGGLFTKAEFLARLYVRSLGQDAIIVEAGKVLEEAKGEPIENSLTARSLDNRPVLDDSGKYLGKVDDIVVAEDSMTVAALVVSTGLFDTMLHGKPRVPFTLVKAIGKDSVIIPASHELRPEPQPAAKQP